MEIKPNKQQQKAIDLLDGPVMLLAGPGTGKTFTIIERIKNILSKGVEPEKILCLTFTDAAATEMKKRIEKELNVDILKEDKYITIKLYKDYDYITPGLNKIFKSDEISVERTIYYE